MLNLGCSAKMSDECGYSLINWEEDIIDIAVEQCDVKEDSLGHRVVFYGDYDGEAVVDYVIGASLLRNRLRKLNKAGFDAPMTREAIKIVEQKYSAVVTH